MAENSTFTCWLSFLAPIIGSSIVAFVLLYAQTALRQANAINVIKDLSDRLMKISPTLTYELAQLNDEQIISMKGLNVRDGSCSEVIERDEKEKERFLSIRAEGIKMLNALEVALIAYEYGIGNKEIIKKHIAHVCYAMLKERKLRHWIEQQEKDRRYPCIQKFWGEVLGPKFEKYEKEQI